MFNALDWIIDTPEYQNAPPLIRLQLIGFALKWDIHSEEERIAAVKAAMNIGAATSFT